MVGWMVGCYNNIVYMQDKFCTNIIDQFSIMLVFTLINLLFVFLSGTPDNSAGYWGDVHCDVPLQTVVNLMEHLNATQDQVRQNIVLNVIIIGISVIIVRMDILDWRFTCS